MSVNAVQRDLVLRKNKIETGMVLKVMEREHPISSIPKINAKNRAPYIMNVKLCLSFWLSHNIYVPTVQNLASYKISYSLSSYFIAPRSISEFRLPVPTFYHSGIIIYSYR
uniref:Uncharacterized protein n=1 Tax=Cacopsylla melanoneura TaxID=428564 RepID=A0A8D8LFU7_9HEMI